MAQSPWLAALNDCPPAAVAEQLLTVCSCPRWAEQVAAARPYDDGEQLQQAADRIWCALGPQDWLQALQGHPAIGEQGGSSREHSRQEQSGIAGSSPEVLSALADGNRRYRARFGHVFLISAAGRSAEQILSELDRRLDNTPEAELREAAEQHRRITRLRLERLLVAGALPVARENPGTPAGSHE